MNIKHSKYLTLTIIIAIVTLIGGYYIGQYVKPIHIITITQTVTITQEKPISVVDALGRSIDFDEIPDKVVSLAPSITEILFALGLGDKVVGVTSFCNYPPKVLELVKQGKISVIGGFWTPDVEKIIALQPDLVIGSAGTMPHIQLREKLEGLGIKIMYVKGSGASDAYEIYEDITIIATVFGVETKAKTLIKEIENTVNNVSKILQQTNITKLKILQLIGPPSWGLYSSGGDTFTNWVISSAGGINIAQKFSGWPQLNYEYILEQNPDIIIISVMGVNYTDIVNEIKTTPLINTKAFKENRIYLINQEANDVLARPGPRIGKAVLLVAKILYPELFGEPDIPIVYKIQG